MTDLPEVQAERRTDRRGTVLLDGKTVIVTGVGVGLGRECAVSALRDGAHVVLGARRKDELATVAAHLDPSGQRPRLAGDMEMDVGRPGPLQ